MTNSDFNLERLNAAQLEQHIAASIVSGSNLAIFGKRGSGKSQIARQQIEKANYHEAYMNLSVFERSDFGYPLLFNQQKANGKNENEEQFVRFMLPQIFRPMLYGDKPVVLLADELDKAQPDLWAPMLEITQEKSINGRKLPNLKCVLMTGNLISEGGSRPCLPLL